MQNEREPATANPEPAKPPAIVVAVPTQTKKFCQSCEETLSCAFVCADCHKSVLQRSRRKHNAVKKLRDESALVFQEILTEQTRKLAFAMECQDLEARNAELEFKLKKIRDMTAEFNLAKHAWEVKYKSRLAELSAAQSRLQLGLEFRTNVTEPVLDSLDITTRHVEQQVIVERRKKMDQLFSLFPIVLPNTICGLDLSQAKDADLGIDLVGRLVILASYYLRTPMMHKLTYSKGDVWVLLSKTGEVVRVRPQAAFFKVMAVDSRMLAERQGVPPEELSASDFLVNLQKLFKD